MSTTLDLSGLDARQRQLASLKNLDATPLMVWWGTVIEEDNRRGVLAGLDKDGVPMVPVTYRPKPETHLGKPFTQTLRIGDKPKGKGSRDIKATLKQFRLGQKMSKRGGQFAGFGAFSSGINNNLSTSEYKLLGGPPLAPRDQFSRVITNLLLKVVKPGQEGPYWAAVGVWDEVVDRKGRAFLKYHFDGIGQIRRDLRGVRPAGIAKALDALQNWARTTIHEHFSK